MLDRLPVVRNVYGALKQVFESMIKTASAQHGFEKVGLIEFPSKGLWSLVFVTGETKGEIGLSRPGGEEDLLTVFMPTGIVPPTGFICFIPRQRRHVSQDVGRGRGQDHHLRRHGSSRLSGPPEAAC